MVSSRLRLSPRLGVLLSGVTTALAVAASLFATRFGPFAAAIAVVLSFVLSSTVSYLTTYRRILSLQENKKTFLTEIVLARLVNVYRSEIADCELRANVMTLQYRDHPEKGRAHNEYLQIKYTFSTYTREEKEREYEPGEGCAGIALQEDNPTHYDELDPGRAADGMTEKQQEATEEVKSVLSVPIYPDNDPTRRPIGVLNLDSEAYIGDTNFNTETAQTLVMRYAGAVGDIIS